MKHLKDEHIDEFIQEALHHEIENIPSPPISADDAWMKLRSKLNEQRPTPNHSIFRKKIIYSVAILFIVSLIVFSPQGSEAYSKVIEIFQKVQGNVIQLFGKVGDNDPTNGDAPSSESDDIMIINESEILTIQLDLEGARQATDFMINIPKVVPEGFFLKDVTVFKRADEQSKDIILNYEGKGRSFNVIQKPVEDSLSFGVTANNDEVQVESIEINGNPANLLQHDNGFLELIWVTGSHYYSISGVISQDEIIEIAKSI